MIYGHIHITYKSYREVLTQRLKLLAGIVVVFVLEVLALHHLQRLSQDTQRADSGGVRGLCAVYTDVGGWACVHVSSSFTISKDCINGGCVGVCTCSSEPSHLHRLSHHTQRADSGGVRGLWVLYMYICIYKWACACMYR